ncbi:MAG: HAMP domain-containing sensor histidine kinase [Pseudomonadota bacterium]
MKSKLSSSTFRWFIFTTAIIWLIMASLLMLSQHLITTITRDSAKEKNHHFFQEIREHWQYGENFFSEYEEQERFLKDLNTNWKSVFSMKKFLMRYIKNIEVAEKLWSKQLSKESWKVNEVFLQARKYLLGENQKNPLNELEIAFNVRSFWYRTYQLMQNEVPENLHHYLEVIIEGRLQKQVEHENVFLSYEDISQWLQNHSSFFEGEFCVALLSKEQAIITNMDIDTYEHLLLHQEHFLWQGTLKVSEEEQEEEQITCYISSFSLDDDSQLFLGVHYDVWFEVENQLLWLSRLGLAVSLLIALLASWLIRRRSLQRLQAINDTCLKIQQGNLSIRIPELGSKDELDTLSININQMLEKIESLMMGVKQVADSIAHDLRTPLTRLVSKIEMVRTQYPDMDQSLEEIFKEADRLMTIFNALLRISQVESGTQREYFAKQSLVAIVSPVTEFYEPAFQEKNIQLQKKLPKESIEIVGDKNLLSQLMTNLLDNALKYTPENGKVLIKLTKNQEVATLIIEDSGPGIAESEIKQVFQRFYRAEKHRSTAGNGLGLAFVKAVIELHQAHIQLKNRYNSVESDERNFSGLKIILSFRCYE